ncbi:hypothetical protein SAMN02745157_4977 [Kaistia soli DSM 19436]|uniref:Uncharacterized protein n=1 Tax=Kaistia soli DSM 19436 TaxID=1122133 RepID=A0A1M5NEF4_9HYPH|nr:hypothetical protein [Kaistia soli]SHG87954.1 hypothetical protein SAMN02745157_4977 [Kaistia soli DSM 19436]
MTEATSMNSPVLLLIFRRPETTQAVMNALALSKPKRLYIAADGPRNAAEAAICEATRAVATNVSWDCEVHTLFRDENLGLRRSVQSGLDWFFEHEMRGIILEDDCVPAPDFFQFCDELLEYYADDTRVGAIAGTTYTRPGDVSDSYYFSRNLNVWGWATWRRAWKLNDPDMKDWPHLRKTEFLRRLAFGRFGFETFWRSIFDTCYAGGYPQSWAYRWVFSCWSRGLLTCAPAANLVSNVGDDDAATHTTIHDATIHGREALGLSFPLRHPRDVAADGRFEVNQDREVYKLWKAPFRRARMAIGLPAPSTIPKLVKSAIK